MNYVKKVKLILRSLLIDNYLSKKRISQLVSRSEWSKNQFANFENQRLQKVLRVAADSIPAYKHLKVPDSEDGIKKYLHDHCPVVTKTDFLSARADYYPNNGIKKPWTIVGKTSGTTGTPLDIFRSYSSIIWENAFIKKHWSLAGTVGEFSRATLRGDEIIPAAQIAPPFWLNNEFDNQLILSSKHLKPHTIDSFIKQIENYSPNILQAYPSTAFVLAEYLDKSNIKLRVPFVFTGSEMLYPYQRELIEKNIGKVIDFYGMAERVAMATECLYGNLHVNSDYSYVEILDENDQPTEDVGYIVGTTFHNLSMPLIRYKLSDRSKWKKGICQCGSSYPMIEAISGKFEDTVFDATGAVISPSLITFAFKGVEHIERAQVAQTSVCVWEVRVVPSKNYSDIDGDKIKSNLTEIVGKTTDIKIKLVENIALTSAGKFRWVVNELK